MNLAAAFTDACAPNASRASRSTLPTDTSRPPKRKFIIADTPGPTFSTTRNMITGAVHGETWRLILVEARHGIIEQSTAGMRSSRRSSAWPHLVLCVNKMDLVDYDQAVFETHQERVSASSPPTRRTRPRVHPGSALRGDNVVRSVPTTHPGTEGTSLLHPPRRGAHRLRLEPHRLPLPRAIRHPAS